MPVLVHPVAVKRGQRSDGAAARMTALRYHNSTVSLVGSVGHPLCEIRLDRRFQKCVEGRF
jgi:hypothetical protein